MSESSSDEVLLDWSALLPLARASLQTFLARQPEVQSVTRRLHVTDTLLNPDTQGLISPRFDLVVHRWQMLKFSSTFGAALASVLILNVVCSAALAQTV